MSRFSMVGRRVSVLVSQRAAAVMSLVATPRANGLDPYAWLVDVLTRLPAPPSDEACA